MRTTAIVAMLLLLSPIALSVQVSGKTFDWETLKGVPAMVRFSQNGSLGAQVVADAGGNYSVEIRPGAYSVFASYAALEYEENLTFMNDAKLDIGLLPALSDLFPNMALPEAAELNNTVQSLDVPEAPAAPQQYPVAQDAVGSLLPYLLPVIIVPTLVYLYLRRKQKPIIVSDEEAVLRIIREKGSVLQSEINERTGFSEAKTSLIVKSLVSRNIVKKEKRGRDNVLSPKS